MIPEMWRIGFEGLRRRFDSHALQPIRCELQHFGVGVVPGEVNTPWLHPEEPDRIDRTYQFSVYEPFDAQPPNMRLRAMRLEGHGPTLDALKLVVAEAGRCLRSVPREITSTLPLVSLFAAKDLELWLWSVFDLAWAKIPGSPLIAEKELYWNSVRIPYDSDRIGLMLKIGIWTPGPPPEIVEWSKQLPDRFYSRIPDIGAASTQAIDIILAAPLKLGADSMQGLNGSKKGRGGHIDLVPAATRRSQRANGRRLVKVARQDIVRAFLAGRRRWEGTLAEMAARLLAEKKLEVSTATLSRDLKELGVALAGQPRRARGRKQDSPTDLDHLESYHVPDDDVS